MRQERRFQARVARAVRSVPYVKVTREARLPGIVADFLVETPKGSIVIDAKAGPLEGRVLKRVVDQIARYRKVVGRKAVYAVVEGLARSRPDAGLLALADVPLWIRRVGFPVPGPVLKAATKRGGRAAKAKAPVAPPPSPPRPIVFVAMPFDARYDDTYFVAMVGAAKAAGAACDRVDQASFVGEIVSEIQRRIRRARVVIADLSEARPNVLYETGYAHALPRPTIHVCSTPMGDLPFDVRNWNTLRYELGRTHQLRRDLTSRLKAVLRSDDA